MGIFVALMMVPLHLEGGDWWLFYFATFFAISTSHISTK